MAATLLAIAWGRGGAPYPGRLVFLLGLAGVLWWTATTLGQVLAPTVDGKILACKLGWLGVAAAPTYWAMAIRAYTGSSAAPGWRAIAAVALFAVAATVAALTNDSHRAIYTHYDVRVGEHGVVAVTYHYGWLFWSLIAILQLNVIAGVAAALRAAWGNAAIFRRQFVGLVLAMLLPWGLNLVGLATGFTLWDVDPEPFAFTLTGLMLALLMRDGELFRLAPIAHRVVLDIIPDPVIVLDSERRIVEANPAAERLLKLGADVVGRRLDGPPSLIRHLDGAGRAAGTSDVAVPELACAFEMASTPLDGWGRPGGLLLVLRDITARRAAEARLAAATAALTDRLAQNLDLQRRLQEEALRDPLTGLSNRRHAHAVLPDMVAAAVAEGRPLAVVIIDLDHFKSFNDRYGHAAGDAALCAFAGVLAADLRPPELGFRWGGEEFLAVLPDAGRAAALERCGLWRARLQAAPLAAADGHAVTFSAGVAVAVEAGADLDALVRAADVALYRAKVGGRDRSIAWGGDGRPGARAAS
jgi:diguanylate cyclase (GGDEF)-like protein